MATVFSGTWKKSNQPLMLKLDQLSQVLQNEFEIEISPAKMLVDEDYRNLVIDEISQLQHHDVNNIINWLSNSPVTSSAKTDTELVKAKKLPNLLLILGLSMVVVASLYWYFNQQSLEQTPSVNDTPIKVAVQKETAIAETTPTMTKTQKLASKTSQIANTLPKRKMAFRLHGSNTIGEKLAPMLLEGFLQQQGINEFSWNKSAPLERALHYSHEGQDYAIELKSHGSSTAFSALNQSKADIGMSSRRIKQSEAKGLANKVGNLNKLGNEHIIGLDGLAVIVNQNNQVKQLSSKTLAKIFSGEVTNWSQIGGASLPIKLYARDQHSGTWDTFKSLVLKKYDKKLSQQAIRLESSSELSTQVSQNEAAIGFIGLNYVLHNKALAISASADTGAIFPTRFTVSTEDYALARRLYFYTPTSASTLVKDFAQYALSTSGQKIVASAGLISQNIKLEQVYPLAQAPKKYQQYAKEAKRLSLNFRFDYATKDLDNKGKRDLQRLIDFMEDHQNRRVVLMGFSDSIGAKTKNNQLSFKRAKSVELALTSRGIPVLAVEAMGEALPIANNNTEAGRKRNRRVEVWLL